ncbi:MAG: cytidylyltransferase domain-containing protein [Limisphaerales bacterium]
MSWFDDLQVWIPAQGGSTRVKNKNTREFYDGSSLLQIKIQQLLEYVEGKRVYVSSESEDAKCQAHELGCRTIKRESALVGNKIKQHDLFSHFFQNTEPSKYILWCQVTDPLFSNFSGFLRNPLKKGKSRILVSELHKHVIYNNLPLNFQYGPWHKTTQDIEPIIVPRWSCFLHHYSSLKTLRYHFGEENEFYTTDDPLIDIDTLNDFKTAQILFSQLKQGF